MATQNTQLCCCGASTWTSFFALLQIVGGLFGFIGASILLAEEDEILGQGNGDMIRDLAQPILIVVLVLTLFSFVLGILLFCGNQREELDLLWTWLTAAGIYVVLVVIFGILTNLVLTVYSAAYSGFMIYVVHRRIQDIKLSSGGRLLGRGENEL